jgi:hypothetical protein
VRDTVTQAAVETGLRGQGRAAGPEPGRCNVAAHLEPGGYLVIEVMIPGLQRLPPGETFQAFTVTPTHLSFDEYDVAAQGLVSHHYWVIEGQLELLSSPFR